MNFHPLAFLHRFWLKTAVPVLLLFVVLLPGRAVAQSAILEKYVQEGLNANLDLKTQSLRIAEQQEAIRQAKALGLPNFTFDANYTVAAGGRKIDFPIGDLLNGVYNNLNALNAVPGNLPPGVVPGQFPTLENQEVQFLPHNFHETKVSFAYPLFNTDLRYNRQIQQHLLENKNAMYAASSHALRYQITEAYLNYLRVQEAINIWQNSRSVLLELRRFNESLVKNNVATRDVVSTADYEISKADREIATLQAQQDNAKAYFNFLINKDLTNTIEVDSSLLGAKVAPYDPAQLVRQSIENRPEFDALAAGQAAAETDIRRNEANLKLPDLYIGGSFGYQGFGYTFSKEQLYGLAQVGLSYPLFDGGIRKSKVQSARIQREVLGAQQQYTEQQIALQVTAAWNEFEAAQTGFKTAQSGLKAAEESFRITQNKYRAGQVILLEYLDAQNRVTSARLQQVLAWSEVLLKEAALRQAAGI